MPALAKPAYYHVSLVLREGIKASDMTRRLDLALDWIEYSKNSWILYTNKDANEWFRRLEPFARPDGQLLICRLDPTDTQGWMSEEFWDWIHQKR